MILNTRFCFCVLFDSSAANFLDLLYKVKINAVWIINPTVRIT